MVKQQNRNTGNKGESAATDKLQSEGYEILARNYRNKWGEVDIIAKIQRKNMQWFNPCMEEVVVFVEVKTKTGGEYGEPWEMINKHKLKAVENMGHLWCEEMEWKGLCRIDVVGVWLNDMGEVARIEHWTDVQM